MKHGAETWLRDILRSIEAIDEYVADSSKEEFLGSQDLQDKVMWRFTVIGEAVNNLTGEFKLQYPEITWQKAADMRNFAVHEYFGIDFGVIWSTIVEDLPMFKKQIEEILEGVGK